MPKKEEKKETRKEPSYSNAREKDIDTKVKASEKMYQTFDPEETEVKRVLALGFHVKEQVIVEGKMLYIFDAKESEIKGGAK